MLVKNLVFVLINQKNIKVTRAQDDGKVVEVATSTVDKAEDVIFNLGV